MVQKSAKKKKITLKKCNFSKNALFLFRRNSEEKNCEFFEISRIKEKRISHIVCTHKLDIFSVELIGGGTDSLTT